MLKVGLTGGIGVGKTTVSDCFERLGVPVIDTDVIAREVVQPGSPALAKIVASFGQDIVTETGELDRQRLGGMVFPDPSKRKKLEAILHPEIKRRTLERARALDVEYCILVVPLLVETDFIDAVDRVLVIDAPDSERIEWIKKRSGLTDSTIADIMAAQTSREKRLEAADYVIVNDGSIAELEAKVLQLHRRILDSLKGVA